MADGPYYGGVRIATTPKTDQFAAFADIFGHSPPPGRIPRSPGRTRSDVVNQWQRPQAANEASNESPGWTHTRGPRPGSVSSILVDVHPGSSQTVLSHSKSQTNLVPAQLNTGITRSVSQVWSGIKHNVAPRSLSAAGYPRQRGLSDQRAMSMTSASAATTRGGRAIPQRGSETFGYAHGGDTGSETLVTRKASSSTISSLSTLARSTIVTTSRREPLVYPALLSKVAAKFSERITLGDHHKNELTYKNSFTGSEAVDVIAYIIKTPDRNLALLLGRALDAQKFFHDVTYENRLRDSPAELYQFSSQGQGPVAPSSLDPHTTVRQTESSSVNGVFTLLTDCYSPTCTRDKLCYSISCPRRLEQQARLNMKLDPGLLTDSRLSVQGEEEEQKLWISTVPAEVADKLTKQERKRQEVICEFIYTERDFVKDLEYLRDYWIKPLRRSNIIPESRRDKFIRTVFLNVLEVHSANIKFAEALTKRQQQNPVVEEIADIVLEYAARFEPFIRYGASQLYGKNEFEREKAANAAFAKFVEETERLPESRMLELNGYLSKPTTRLARYPLLLEAILKQTTPENSDHKNIPLAIAKIREFLTRLNVESGKTENRFALAQLNQYLLFRPGEYIDLKLTDEKRQLVYEGTLQKRPGEGEMQAYLFDNAILFVKNKTTNKREVLKVNSKPIPLQLLRVYDYDDSVPKGMSAPSSTSSFRKGSVAMIRGAGKNVDSFPITFQHLGRRGYEVTLYAPNYQARRTWVEQIVKQQEALREQSDVYTLHVLQSNFFGPTARITCAKPFDGGRKLLYGTMQGIFMSDITFESGNQNKRVVTRPTLVLQAPGVVQLDVLDIYGILLYLAEKTINSLSLELLESNSDALANVKRARFVAGQASFYKVDECMGRTLLSVIKSHSLNANVRVMEPTDLIRPSQKRPQLKRLLTAGQASVSEGFKPFKPAVDVPSAMMSISYLRNHLCLGCSKGFELLDLNTMKIESLLDPADTSLDFVIKKDSLRPLSIYRIGKEFLLNYSDFSFFINRNGWRSRQGWIIQWESVPQHIVLSYPYLIAFDTSFIEIRNMDTELLQVIHKENIRFLHESTHEILYVHENERGQDEVVAINFWEKQKRVDQS